MPLSRVGLIVLVIGTAVAGSYFSITNPLKLGEKTPATAILGSSNEAKKQGNLLTPKSPLEIAEESTTPPTQKGLLANIGGTNLTNQITETLSNFLIEGIMEKNGDGPVMQDGKNSIVAPNEQDIANLINLDAEFFAKTENTTTQERVYHPKVYETILNITTDTSKTTQKKYMGTLLEIGKTHSETITKTDNEILNELLKLSDATSAKRLADMYGDIVSKYITLSIPANWVATHKEILSYYFTAQAIWQDIANYHTDPLRALAALQALETLQIAAKGIPELIIREMAKNGIGIDNLYQ